MVPIPFDRNLAASAFTAASELARWNGDSAPGEVSSGMSSLENPTIPTLTPPKVSTTTDGLHSAGVFPCESTMLADKYRKLASGTSVLRRYAWPRSKLWLPRPSKVKPIAFISSMVGVSPKKEEIGGVAPTESPPATVTDP